MFLFDFLPDEHERIANLQNTEESCAAYGEHYKQLSPEEAAIAGYMLCAAGKQYVEGYENDIEIIYPFDCVAQNNVNGGWGQMFSINPDCFVAPEEVKLFYVRNTMWLPEHRKDEPIPQWIENIAHDMRCFPSGLADIKPEIIQFTFDSCPPCDYYAITFRLSKENVKRRIKLDGEVFYMANIGDYILTLTDITGEYEACFGELHDGNPIVLEEMSMDFE